ncbi:MAG: NAD-dependent DNA ligase LigA [Candidatus Omnitrophica bacterium]|nr:NAD-dependent DNA ligase LigA [Candidatus Omnitrophota bacterium]
MSADIKKKIEKLRQAIRKHDYLYYVINQPQISDREYDELMRQLKDLEEKYPEYISSDSPTVRVSGGVLEGFKTVKHLQKMLSLDNTYSFDELKDWDERVHKGLGGAAKIEYVVELKIDGLSANITYEKGRFTIGATRGDGEAGEDVTSNIKTIRAIPLVLLDGDIPDLIEIRGEVYMDIKEFQAMNKEREKQGLELFANPRNAASGSLKLLDTGIVAARKLNFFAHSLGTYKGMEVLTHWGYLEKLQRWGVRTNPQSKLCKNLGEVIDYCKHWQDKRQSLAYQIDGIVVKINSIAQQKKLGYTLKSPRWAVAYKFPAHQATTDVIRIIFNVGRTGIITPVAELKPVGCAGVIIKHATLHNFDEIKRLDIREGDRVLIERAGEVIPKVVKVVKKLGKKPVQVPRACPVCAGKVVKEKEADVAFRCINPVCPAQLERGLLHFASRQAMDIEGFGESAVAQLVKLKLVRNFADIYKLKEEDLLRLELFKDKKVRNLLSGIQKSKSRQLWRLIYALGIRHVGEKAAYVLAKEFKTMDNLIKAKKEDLDAISDVGSVMAQSIREYFSQTQTREIIEGLRKSGLNFKEEVTEDLSGPLSGKTVVFTGELKSYSRHEAEELARRHGASPASSVSTNTDLVIAGESPGSKYDKAKKLGVKVIHETEFKEMLK